MESRRGQWTLWLLAAGSFVLVGCRTPTGSEESSSWFNFSSRRGGQGRSSAGTAKPEKKPLATTTERTAEIPPSPKPAPAKPPEPAKPTKPAENKTAPIAPPDAAKPTAAPPAEVATGGPEARRLPVPIDAGPTPEPRAPASSLGLKSPPEASPTLRTNQPLELTIPAGVRATGSPATPLTIAPGQGTKDLRTGTALPLPEPVATTGRRPPKSSLRLPGLDATEPATTDRPRLTLPEVAGSSAQREAPTALHLPAGEAPTAREGLSPRLPLASLDEPTRGRTAEATSLPGLAVLAPTGEERTGRPISGIGDLDEPTSKKPPPSGLALPAPEAGPTQASATNTRLALPNVAAVDPGRDPAERLRIAIGEVEPTPVASGPSPSGSAGKPPERADRPLAPSRALPPFDPASLATTSGERALRATAPEAKPTVATVPLPFRLSAWVSDEETHRRWREQQLDRAGAEERARQAEQERLRQALLRFLVPVAPAK
ncbi:uncharacterized protein KIAA0754 [Opitutia bacterium]|nr:uncharacterized protein KIAA0754 [Opitutae bacterium]